MQDGIPREVPADHGGPLDHGPVACLESVEPARKEGFDRGWHDLDVRRADVLGQVGVELLEKERVSLRDCDDALSKCARQLDLCC